MKNYQLFEIENHGIGSFGKNESPAIWIELVEIDEDGYAGPMHTTRLFLTPKAIEPAMRQLVAIGWEGDDIDALSDPGPIELENPDRTRDLRGLRVKAEVTETEYEGKARTEIGWLNHPDSVGKGGGLARFAGIIQDTAMKKIRLDAKAHLKAIRAGESPKAKPAKPTKPAATKPEPVEDADSDDDDELPF